MDASAPFKPDAAGGNAGRSLVIRNLRKEYRAGQPVLKNVSLTLEGRGMTAIIGPSGTGKRARHGARYRAVEPLLGPGRAGAVRHFRGGHCG